MRRVTYLGAISGHEGNYGILFPDFLGCVSGGESVAATIRNGHDALQFHVEGMEEDDQPIPPPGVHSIERVATDFLTDDDPDPDNWVGLFPIEVTVAEVPDREATTTVRVKAGLVEKIAEVAARTASRIDSRHFIEQAVEREIERYRKSAA